MGSKVDLIKISNQYDLSIVIPFYNEEESLSILYEKIVLVLNKLGKSYEIIFIDDGSTDNSYNIVSDIQNGDPNLKIVKFRSNFGKAKALNEGFKKAKGRIVFTMDADLQDDPEEIPNFLNKIDEGFDLVSGWKIKRHDPLEKRLPSKLFNKTTSLVTGLKLHDFNCGFKAYKREILEEIRVYGELHRYIPALAHWQGYTVGEISVRHHARKFGVSKYGWERYFRGLFDLCTVVLLTKYIRNPLHLFGFSGIASLLVGTVILCFLTGLQILYGGILGHRPLSFFAVLLILVGGQLVSLGLMAEFLSNISQKRGGRKISIRGMKNIREINEQKHPYISIVIPIHNEAGNINILYEQLIISLAKLKGQYEIIFVDDGSTDNSYDQIELLANVNKNVKVLKLRKRFGKASALNAGFNYTTGRLIVTLDGDLQDNPAEIEKFLAKIENGKDFVCGKRTKVPFPRKVFSRTFNIIVSIFSGVKLSDINCGFKVFKREVVEDITLYGELQRFLPVLASQNGYKISEVDVVHRERHSGESKYGWSRIPKGFLDMITVILLTGYRRRPLHFFGSIGLITSCFGFIICGGLTCLKLLTGSIQGHNTLLLMGVMFLALGFQWFSSGLLGEMINDLDELIATDNITDSSVD